MEYFIGSILGFIVAFIVFTFCNFGQDNELIEELTKCKKEKAELEKVLNNAESRVTRFARIIKQIEDVIRNAAANHEFAVETMNKIKSILSDNRKLTK